MGGRVRVKCGIVRWLSGKLVEGLWSKNFFGTKDSLGVKLHAASDRPATPCLKHTFTVRKSKSVSLMLSRLVIEIRQKSWKVLWALTLLSCKISTGSNTERPKLATLEFPKPLAQA